MSDVTAKSFALFKTELRDLASALGVHPDWAATGVPVYVYWVSKYSAGVRYLESDIGGGGVLPRECLIGLPGEPATLPDRSAGPRKKVGWHGGMRKA
jgi:hypothetical protein